MKVVDFRTYGFMGAIRKHFGDRAEARKPPPTEHERLRQAIEDICHYNHPHGPPPYRAGLFEVSSSGTFYDGEQATFYQITYNNELIWSGTSWGYFNPFDGRWVLEGPWQDSALAVLEANAVMLKARHAEEKEKRLARELEEYAAEERAAKERHRELIRHFHTASSA